jgi:inosine-uridine nucleoside N-ribohydrolase
MPALPRSWAQITASIGLVLVGLATSVSGAPAPVPVILNTDIGDDIDDTWALVMLLKSPNLDVRLITTDFGNTVYRAKIVARFLELAGRTDIPIGIGIQESEEEGDQAEWVRDYDLATYSGIVHEDGVRAFIDTVMAAEETITLIAIGPPSSLAAALEREPRIAGRLRLAGMYGSLSHGYDGGPEPAADWNVRADVPAARVLLAAPWVEAIVTPLDTCGLVRLKGDRYARVRDSKDPLLVALIENYRMWCPRSEWCRGDASQVRVQSTTLFDTVAVYLAEARDLVKIQRFGVRISDGGMTVPDEGAPPLAWATEWESLDEFEQLLTDRLVGPERGQ